jgi:signal peptidase II
MKKALLFWPLLLVLVLADCGSKRIVEETVAPHTPHEVLGDVVRVTLGYNPGAAFGLHVGPASRIVFTILTFVALAALGLMYRAASPDRRIEVMALALISGGAIGNLIDRIWAGQVVDWIDVGLGATRFWTFNIADAGITVGAVLLALTFLASPDPSDPAVSEQAAAEAAGD